MTFLTRLGGRWLGPLAVAGLLAGCQSSRSAFQFAPVAPYANASPAGTASASVNQAALADAPATTLPLAAPAAFSTRAALPAPLRRVVRHPGARPGPGSAGVVVNEPIDAAATGQAAVASRPHRHRAAPARPTESGLGRIALFFLAIFLGVLAGLGALVSLIPGVSFLGGVGLAAAGLLVLFLLYSLLSGGSKKKVKAK